MQRSWYLKAPYSPLCHRRGHQYYKVLGSELGPHSFIFTSRTALKVTFQLIPSQKRLLWSLFNLLWPRTTGTVSLPFAEPLGIGGQFSSRASNAQWVYYSELKMCPAASRAPTCKEIPGITFTNRAGSEWRDSQWCLPGVINETTVFHFRHCFNSIVI